MECVSQRGIELLQREGLGEVRYGRDAEPLDPLGGALAEDRDLRVRGAGAACKPAPLGRGGLDQQHIGAAKARGRGWGTIGDVDGFIAEAAATIRTSSSCTVG